MGSTVDLIRDASRPSSAISSLDLRGWIELEGTRLSDREVLAALSQDPGKVLQFGGEFFLKWDECAARDHFGIMPGECPPGALICRGEGAGKVDPGYPIMDLGEAIQVAVRLRSDEGVVALSGGVDSALVAKFAERECVVVGLEGSHDLLHASRVADELALSLEQVVIDPGSIEEVLRAVLRVIPEVDPVNASIATTLFYVACWAGERGHRRILAGQGADELFGGYARYLQTETLGQDMERDFQGLASQLARDQAVANIFGAYFSLPYMDLRVVRTARSIPPEIKVCDGVRKRQLREVAERYLPASIARYEKKAMQYGSGVMKEIQRLANRNGYKKSVQEYVDKMAAEEGRVILRGEKGRMSN
jgi:asparagine synthase (glutamine-hydrolysing)